MRSLSCICHLPSQLSTYSSLGNVAAEAGLSGEQRTCRSELRTTRSCGPASDSLQSHRLCVLSSGRCSNPVSNRVTALLFPVCSRPQLCPHRISLRPTPSRSQARQLFLRVALPQPGPPLTPLCDKTPSLSASPDEFHRSRALDAQGMAAPSINAQEMFNE